MSIIRPTGLGDNGASAKVSLALLSENPTIAIERIREQLSRTQDAVETARKLKDRGLHLLSSDTQSRMEKLDVGDLVELDRALQAVQWIETIRKIGKEMDDLWLASISSGGSKKRIAVVGGSSGGGVGNVKEEDPDKQIQRRQRVVQQHRLLVALVAALRQSACKHLAAYGVQMLAVHRERWITCHLEGQLKAELDALHFPQCILDIEHHSATQDEDINLKLAARNYLNNSTTSEELVHIGLLQDIYSMMCDLKLPEAVANDLTGLKASDPMAILLDPLKKRFKFHFSGNKKTNNPEKPEWYLQQVGAWMKNSQRFFEVCIHPARRLDMTMEFPGHAQFCCGLLGLAVKKLHHDVSELIYDDILLSHLIDEIIHFSRDILSRDFSLHIPMDRLPLVILCDPVVFTRWISLERKFATEKVDDLLLEEGCWQPSLARSDVSRCVLTFEAMLQSMTNRYKSMTSLQLQLNFVDLQIELLEDLRLRIAQILRQEQAFPLSEKFCLILSSSQYLIDMLTAWTEVPVFLQLQHERLKDDDTMSKQGLFYDVIGEFEFLVNDLIRTLSKHIVNEVISRSKPYRVDLKWFSYVSFNDASGDCAWDTTPESFPMFQILSADLTYLSKLLNRNALLSRIVSQVYEQLCSFFITDIILENMFSVDGCRQLSVDVNRGLIAIFEPLLAVDKDPETVSQLRDVCKLLTLKQANAVLLLEALRGEDKSIGKSKSGKINANSNSNTILDEFGITSLSPERTIKILKRRVDLQ